MKTYYICVEAGVEGLKLTANWFEWYDDQLIFYTGPIGDEENSFVTAVFKKWDYFFEVKE